MIQCVNGSCLLRQRVKRYFFQSRAACQRSMDVHHYKVGIVGAGPVGLLLARILQSYGVDHCLIDRRAEPVEHPQAHFINARSMEVLQNCAPNAFAKVIEQSPDSFNWRYINSKLNDDTISTHFTHPLVCNFGNH